MLQFWKKTSDNDKNCCSSNATNVKLELDKTTKPPLKYFENDTLIGIDEYESKRERSKLCKNLNEVLQDKSALAYFIQFMDSRSCSSYIHCYMDVANFKADLVQCKKGDHDSLSISTDCDSNSLYDTQNLCDQDLSDSRSLEETSVTDSAVSIFKKYIAQEATYNIKCSDTIRNEIIENVCDSNTVLTGSCFSKVQDFCFETMQKEYFDMFLSSDFYCKYQIDVLTSGKVALDDILYNETALFYFMEFLEQENASQLLEFWIAATNLQQHLQNQKDFFDPYEAQTDAVVLYDKYFSLQATCPLGFGDKVRFDIEQHICGENGLQIDCFQIPLKLTEQVLDRNYLKPFLASQLFYKYLSELISTVSNSNLNNYESSRTFPSDCSSERSFPSTNSTFLALEINGNSAAKKRDKGADMCIDTRQLCDPDSLWKRRRSHRLSCGRITALGKFETDLEPEPDKNGFKLKNVIRRFVSLDEDKKKEEMAWQVAEMIVKDITNVTLQEKNRHS